MNGVATLYVTTPLLVIVKLVTLLSFSNDAELAKDSTSDVFVIVVSGVVANENH
jgi:hypothetical protein